MPSAVDLHTHTTASDGTLTPQELLSAAAALDVKVLAISDHDSTAGYDALHAAPSTHPHIRLIPAIEMSAEGEFACHLLGYFIDASNETFQRRLTALRERRVARVRAMAEKLGSLGFPLEWELVLAQSRGTLGRPHLADALMAKGYVRSRQEAFDRFLKRDGAAYIAASEPTARDSIALIREAGGIPVLAHPSFDTSSRLLQGLIDNGLMGIEAYYPEHSRSLIRHYVEAAEKFGLVVTGGSDFHGPRTGRHTLACVDVPLQVVETLENLKNKV